jgi:hypothetical protein
MNHLDQFLKNKVAEMRRAAPDCDVWLFPESCGYTSYRNVNESVTIPLEGVSKHIAEKTSKGLSVALLDRVSLGQHGGWKTILIAKIPATKKIETEGDFA